MFWYCRFKWHPGTTGERVRARVVEQHLSGANHPELIRGWYNLAGGGAGFLLIETDEVRDVNAIIEPYMDLAAWDVHAFYELPYGAVTAALQQKLEEDGLSEAERKRIALEEMRPFLESLMSCP